MNIQKIMASGLLAVMMLFALSFSKTASAAPFAMANGQGTAVSTYGSTNWWHHHRRHHHHTSVGVNIHL